jgi:hypothetical protein
MPTSRSPASTTENSSNDPNITPNPPPPKKLHPQVLTITPMARPNHAMHSAEAAPRRGWSPSSSVQHGIGSPTAR